MRVRIADEVKKLVEVDAPGEVVTLGHYDDKHLTTADGTLVASQSNSTGTVYLYNGYKVAEKWVKTEGTITPTFPEFQGVKNIQYMDNLIVGNNDKVSVKDQYVVAYQASNGDVYHRLPQVPFVRFTKGDKCIEVRWDGVITIKGYGILCPWVEKGTSPIDVTKVTWDGKVLCEGDTTIGCLTTSGDRFSRFGPVGRYTWNHST